MITPVRSPSVFNLLALAVIGRAQADSLLDLRKVAKGRWSRRLHNTVRWYENDLETWSKATSYDYQTFLTGLEERGIPTTLAEYRHNRRRAAHSTVPQ